MKAIKHSIMCLLVLAAMGGARLGYGQTRPATNADSEVVATINGQKKITLKEVDDLAGPELQGLLDKITALRKRALNNLIVRTLLEDKARAKGLTVEQYSKLLLPEHVEVEQKQVDDLYLANANRFPSLSEAEAKQRIKLDLENRAKFEAYQKAIAAMREQANVAILLREPVGPTVNVNATGPAKGAGNAPVTIVEFSDFQCPFCKEASITMRQLLASSGNNVKLIYKHMPLPNHQWAFQAAQAAVCANEQGKFWEYHDRLFERSIDLSTESLRRYAADLGLKATEFNACLESETSRAAVMRDVQEAKQAGILGTPTFIINGKVLRGAKTLEEFRAVIERELKKTNPAGTAAQLQVGRTGQ
jgi:protein-disulfide isomerase